MRMQADQLQSLNANDSTEEQSGAEKSGDAWKKAFGELKKKSFRIKEYYCIIRLSELCNLSQETE